MKKTKVIALVLMASIVLMGVGYAWWSETVTIPATVNTGELLVEFVDQHRDLSYPYLFYPYFFPQHYTYPDSAGELELADSHTLNANFTNFFPGMNYSVPFKLENNGTIPARFKTCIVTCDIIDDTLSQEKEDTLIQELYKHILVTNLYIRKLDSSGHQTGSIHVINGSTTTLEYLQQYLYNNALLRDLQLETKDQPGDNILEGEIAFRFSEDFENNMQNRHFIVSLNFEWKQFNED